MPDKANKSKLKEMENEDTEIAPNMKFASEWWGIPRATLIKAKKKGCPAFKGQRITKSLLFGWMETNDRSKEDFEEGLAEEELKRRKLIAQIDALEYKLEKDKKEQVPINLVKDEWARNMAIIFEEAKQLMDAEIYQVFATRCKAKI